MSKLNKLLQIVKESREEDKAEINSIRRAISDLKSKMNNPDYSDEERAKHKDWHDKEVKRLKLYGVDEACWSGYEQIGMKKKNGKKVPNCVPKK